MDMKTLSAAYVRGYMKRTGASLKEEMLLKKELYDLSAEEIDRLIAIGRQKDLKLYRFKEKAELARVHKVMGFLKGVRPENLLDVGSGRGAFLFPFLCEFEGVETVSYDLLDYRVEFINDLARGGIGNVKAEIKDLVTLEEEKRYDVVTLLEVLEHIPEAEKAVFAAVRAAKRYVVVTVPDKPDNNPEHIHLLTKERLKEMFTRAGAVNLRFDGVNGHLFMIAGVERK